MGPCRVCGSTQIDASGYCLNCRNFVGVGPETGAVPTGAVPLVPAKRTGLPVPAIIALIVVGVLVLCCGGIGIVLYGRYRSVHSGAAPVPSPVALTSPRTPVRTSPPAPLTGAACVIGTWRETSNQSDASIDGSTVRLTGSGGIQRFTADGTAVLDYSGGVTLAGSRSGNNYAVSSTGTATLHFQIMGNQILYSNVQATGTTVWLRNGKQYEKEAFSSTMTPETFSCTGDQFIEYGVNYTTVMTRVLPPTPTGGPKIG